MGSDVQMRWVMSLLRPFRQERLLARRDADLIGMHDNYVMAEELHRGEQRGAVVGEEVSGGPGARDRKPDAA